LNIGAEDVLRHRKLLGGYITSLIMNHKIMKKKNLLICLVLSIFLLVTLIVLCVLFLVPRAVDFYPESSGASFSMEAPGTFLIEFLTDVSVTNKNFFSVTVSSRANLSAPLCGRTIGHVSLRETRLPPRSTTSAKLQGTISYRATDDPKFCVLQEMSNGCAYKNLTVSVTGDVKYSTWIKSGSTALTRDMQVDCQSLLSDTHIRT
jgi:hypothetical protein